MTEEQRFLRDVIAEAACADMPTLYQIQQAAIQDVAMASDGDEQTRLVKRVAIIDIIGSLNFENWHCMLPPRMFENPQIKYPAKHLQH